MKCQTKKFKRLILKIIKGADGMAQVVEYLANKCEASTAKNQNKATKIIKDFNEK
jgi:hypothetical protein